KTARSSSKDFTFASGDTKSPTIRGRCSPLDPGFSALCFGFRPYCEFSAAQFALGDVSVGLGPLCERGLAVGTRDVILCLMLRTTSVTAAAHSTFKVYAAAEPKGPKTGEFPAPPNVTVCIPGGRGRMEHQ